MASRPETEALCTAEAEEAPALNLESLDAEGREVASGFRRHRRLALFTGLALGAACLLNVSAIRRESQPDAARLNAAQGKAEDKIEAFHQCGGQGWTNSTCCEKGCACVAETQYYSQCRTPKGLQTCSVERAKVEHKAVAKHVEELKDVLDSRKETLAAAKKTLSKAMEARKDAEKVSTAADDVSDTKKRHLHSVEEEAGSKRKETTDAAKKEFDETLKDTNAELKKKTTEAREVRDKKLKDAHDAHDKAEANAKAKRKAFEAADTKAAAKTKERSIVKEYVDKFEAADKVRKTKKCGGIFSACTATNCCALGCEPDWQNPNYCQCSGPGGAKYCAWQDVVGKYNKSTQAMPILTKDWKSLIEANDTASTDSDDADENFKTVAAQSKSDIEAALKEFNVSTKTPADAAEKKIAAAKKKKEETDKEAEELFKKTTAEARGIWKEAEDKAKAKHKILDGKRHVEAEAARAASEAAKQVTQAKMKLASAKTSVGSWLRAARGNTCGEDGDADKLDF